MLVTTSRTWLLAFAFASAAGAQTPRTAPVDSTRADTARCRCATRDTLPHRGPVDSPLLLFGMVALAAPPLFLMATDSAGASAVPFAFLRHHVALMLSGGPVFSQNQDLGWTHAENLQARLGGIYADARLEHYYLFPQNIRYEIARLGYLLRTHSAAGGITIGYRGAYGPPIEGRQQGLEVGLPFLVGDADRPYLLESYYVMTSPITTWNYRLEHDWPVRGRPLTLGWRAEAMSFPLARGRRIAWFTMATVIGLR